MINFDDIIESLKQKKAALREELEREFAERSAKIDELLAVAGYKEPIAEEPVVDEVVDEVVADVDEVVAEEPAIDEPIVEENAAPVEAEVLNNGENAI